VSVAFTSARRPHVSMIFLAFAVSVRESASLATRAFPSLLCGMAGSAAYSLRLGQSFIRGLPSLSLLIELFAFEEILAVLPDVRKTKRWRSKGAGSE
jgi:hypothetical protein